VQEKADCWTTAYRCTSVPIPLSHICASYTTATYLVPAIASSLRDDNKLHDIACLQLCICLHQVCDSVSNQPLQQSGHLLIVSVPCSKAGSLMGILLQASFPLGVRPLLRQRGGVVKMLRMSALHIWLTHFLRSASCLQSDTLSKLTNHWPACFTCIHLLSASGLR